MPLYTVPTERRYWVVRAMGGYYYDHFTRYETVALGHLDPLRLPSTEGEPFYPDQDELYSRLLKHHSSSEKQTLGTATSHARQVYAFIEEMSVGDWVITVGEKWLRFGRVIGHPHLAQVPLEIWDDPKGVNRRTMSYNLRRPVRWGPTLPRSKMPFGLRRSLSANQTIFNLDEHWYAIYHTLYPAFQCNGNLYLSAYINSSDNLSNYHIASLFTFLNELEVIGKEFDNGLNADNFKLFFDEYIASDRLTITTQAQFHSPGEIWNTVSQFLPHIPNGALYIVLGYSMLFGNQKLGFDGLIDLETRQRIWNIVLSRFERHNVDAAKNKLDLSAPRQDTGKLEDDSRDAQ